MKGKNKELDKQYSHLKFPYEQEFSKIRRRVRYIVIVKNQFSKFLYALSYNIKRLIVLGYPSLEI